MRRAVHLTSRDWVATFFVVVAACVYAVWAAAGSHGETEVRVVTGIVLAFGFAASASAVVPGFEALWHGSKLYLVGTSLLGLGALAAGVTALVTGGESALGVLVAVSVLLWAISTIRHVVAAESARAEAGIGRVPPGTPVPG